MGDRKACGLLGKDFPNRLPLKENKLVAFEGMSEVSRIKMSYILLRRIYRTLSCRGLKVGRLISF